MSVIIKIVSILYFNLADYLSAHNMIIAFLALVAIATYDMWLAGAMSC